jgi:tetratricopeptide (TPR) repeat protein
VGVDVADSTRRGLEAARRAIAINPKLAVAHKAEALNLRFAGDREGERAALMRAIEADSRFNPAWINLAVEDFSAANIAGAERSLRRALENDPQDAFAMMWLVAITRLTGRQEEALAFLQRIRELSSEPYYVTTVHASRASIRLDQGDIAGARRAWNEGNADGARRGDMQALDAAIAYREGRVEEARIRIRELQDVQDGLIAASIFPAAGTAIRLGEIDIAEKMLFRKLLLDLMPTQARLDKELHPLLDREALAPRRRDVTLVWPLEAPMIDPVRFHLFRDVRIESGLPLKSELR